MYPFRSDTTDTWRTKQFKLLCLPQQKGGVGKTTCTYSLAYGLAKAGKKVLAVDSDAQCNLTQEVLGKHVYDHFNGEYTAFYETTGLTDTVMTPMMAALEEDHALRAPQVVNIDIGALEGAQSATGSQAGKLLLLRGDPKITDWDTKVSQALGYSRLEGLSSTKSWPGMFYNLMQITAYVYGVDYVVVDMSPSMSASNRFILMSSNCFIIPYGVDDKNREAINEFGSHLLEGWHAMFSEFRERSAGCRYPLPTHTPMFLGAVATRVGAAGSVRPYNQYLRLTQIQHRIQSKLMPTLQQLSMSLGAAPYLQYAQTAPVIIHTASNRGQSLKLPIIEAGTIGITPDYHRLAHMSQRESIPVPYLSACHLLKMNSAAYQAYLEASAADPNLPMPAESELLMPVTPNDAEDLVQKVARIKTVFDHLVSIVLAH